MNAATMTRKDAIGCSSSGPNSEARKKDFMNKRQQPRPSILSTLPNELLVAIFNCIDDEESLKNLCLVTKNDEQLYEIALARRWRQCTIDDRDLIPAHGHDERTFNKLERKLAKKGVGRLWKPVGETVHELLAQVKPRQRAAHYVQELIIDLRMLRYWDHDFELSGLSVWDFFPSLVSALNTLSMLKPYLNNIRSIESRGDLPQEILEMVTALDTSKIQNLQLRQYDGGGGLREYSSTRLNKPPQMLRLLPPNLDRLAMFDQLRTLSIHHFVSKEVHSLLRLLPKLARLESLSLADEMTEHYGYSSFSRCAIQSLLTSILTVPAEELHSSNEEEHNKVLKLPSSLKSLALWDNGSWQTDPKSQASPMALSLETSLTDVHLFMNELDYAANFLVSLPKQQLRSLTVSGGTHPRLPSFHKLHDVVTDHAASLERIELLQAWMMDFDLINGFNERWNNRFSIQELTLGEMNEVWHYRPPVKPTLTCYLTDHGSTVGEQGLRWGTKLRRLRIDNIDFTDFDAQILNHLSYSGLEIIMLQPFCQDKIPICVPEISADEAMILATATMESAHSNLKVVIIQSHWFYVFSNSINARNIYPWNDATQDTGQQKARQASLLSDADWAFMKRSIPLFWDERQHHEETKQYVPTFHDSSNFEYLYRCNHMAILRD